MFFKIDNYEELFDAIMAKIGAVDLDGNPLSINTEGYKSLEVSSKNIAVGARKSGTGAGDGSGGGGVDDEEIEKAEKLLEIINKIKTAVDEKTEAFKKEKELVNCNRNWQGICWLVYRSK